MVDTQEIYEKSVWPLFTPGLHWALSDTLHNIGLLTRCEDDAAEYVVPTEGLPDGELGLWHVNALRDIRLDVSEWPSHLRKRIECATLCLGSKALQSAQFDSASDTIEFSMFSKDTLLPLFVVDDELLTVRIQFNESVCDLTDLPKHSIDATGLLVRIKERAKPFFVAACAQSTLTWDGQQSRVFASAAAMMMERPERRSEQADKQLFDMRRIDTSIASNDNANFVDLWQTLTNHTTLNTTAWNGLRSSPARPLWEPLPDMIQVAERTPSVTTRDHDDDGRSCDSASTSPPGLVTP